MYNGKRFVALLLAREGSKGLPKKNKLITAGKPMIVWGIEAAKESGLFEDIVVYSNDREILSIALALGVVALQEPLSMAQDDSSIRYAMKEALEQLAQKGKRYDYVQLIQPTAPTIDAPEIKRAVQFLFEKNADFVVGVCKGDTWRIYAEPLSSDLSIKGFLPRELKDGRRQLIEQDRYFLNGAIYLGKSELFYDPDISWYQQNIYAFVMDKWHSVDVDDEYDWVIADAILKRRP